jgi:hypothetical protein
MAVDGEGVSNVRHNAEPTRNRNGASRPEKTPATGEPHPSLFPQPLFLHTCGGMRHVCKTITMSQET